MTLITRAYGARICLVRGQLAGRVAHIVALLVCSGICGMIAMAIGVAKVHADYSNSARVYYHDGLGLGVWLTLGGWVLALLMPFLVWVRARRSRVSATKQQQRQQQQQQQQPGMLLQPMQTGTMFTHQQPRSLQAPMTTTETSAFGVQNAKFSTSYPLPSPQQRTGTNFSVIHFDDSVSVPVSTGPRHRILQLTKQEADAQLMQVLALSSLFQ